MEKEEFDKLSPEQKIQLAKLEFMQRDAKKTNWLDVEDSYVSQWYFVSKIIGHLIPRTFPYFTFKGIVEEINKDPNFKKKEDK